MGTTGEKKGEGLRMLEAPVLGGEFHISFIENWRIRRIIIIARQSARDTKMNNNHILLSQCSKFTEV